METPHALSNVEGVDGKKLGYCNARKEKCINLARNRSEYLAGKQAAMFESKQLNLATAHFKGLTKIML